MKSATIRPAIAAIAASVILLGCATKTRNVEIAGMFTQAESATVAIGTVDIMASPVGEETAIIKYAEDTAWLSPSTKTHEIKIQLTGTNSTTSVTAIVDSICRAFIPVSAIANGVTNAPPLATAPVATAVEIEPLCVDAPTNTVESVK